MIPGKSGFFLFCPHLEINLKYPFRHKTSAVPESSVHLHNLLKDNKKQQYLSWFFIIGFVNPCQDRLKDFY